MLLWAVLLACVSVGAVLLFLSFAPTKLIVHIARLATGSRIPLDEVQYSSLLPRFLITGFFYGGLGSGLLLFRRRLISWLADAIRSLRTALRQTRGALAERLGAVTGWHLLALALIATGALILRLLYLGEPPRYDESFTYLVFASRSLIHVFGYYPEPNNHILHSFLVWICLRIFGDSLWAMRLPALLAGLAVIPLMYITALRRSGRIAALLAAGFLAASGPFVLYSVNARGYTMQAALMLVMLYAAMEILDNAPERLAYWVLFSVAAIAGFWTAPSMLYAYLTVAGWVLWAGGWRMLRPLIISGAATAIAVVALYMPVVVVSGPEAFRSPQLLPLSPQEFRAEALRFPADLIAFLHGSDPPAFAILIAAGVVLSLLFTIRRRSRWADPFLVLLLVLLILPVVQRIVPFPRVLLPLYTVYYLSSAIGLATLTGNAFRRHGTLAPLAFVFLVGALALHVTQSGYVEAAREFPDSGPTAAYLAKHLGPCDRLLITLSAGTELRWQLVHDKVPFLEYSPKEPVMGRVLVVTQKFEKLPPIGNGLRDPSLLTMQGTMRAIAFDTSAYTPPRLIYRSGKAEIFELLPRRYAGGAVPTCQAR